MTAAFDVVAVVLAVVVAAVSLSATLHLERTQVDVDEAVYLQTLESMQHGQGYYDATRDALVAKEGTPPSQLRSVRPPMLFLLLRPFPADAWRWLATVAGLAAMLVAWRLARAASPLAGPVAVVLVGAYVRSALPFLYLHSELWGLPFALASLLAVRRRRWALAAAAIVVAVLFRELYLVFLLAGLVWVPRRRPFVIGAALVVVAGAVHVALASRILDPTGREAAFVLDTSVREALDRLGPGGGPAANLVGLAIAALGVTVLIVASRGDDPPDARVALTAIVPLAVATVTVGRTYWALTFAPVLAVYAAMAVGWLPAPWARGGSAPLPPVRRPPST